MKKYSLFLILSLSLFLSNCSRDTPSIPQQPTNGDSAMICTSIYESTSSAWTYMMYDSVNKRYNGWYYYYGSANYDTIVISYNNDGTIKYIVSKKPSIFTNKQDLDLSVFENNPDKTISKIYRKGPETYYIGNTNYDLTVTTNQLYFYDSINYYPNKQVKSIFTIYPSRNPQIYYYKNFYYSSNNDSLLEKIDYYQYNSVSNNYAIRESLLFQGYDSYKNPLYEKLKDYGLYHFNNFSPLPSNYFNSELLGFSTYSPHNCTKVNNNSITNTYNNENYSNRLYIGVPPVAESVAFTFRKFRN